MFIQASSFALVAALGVNSIMGAPIINGKRQDTTILTGVVQSTGPSILTGVVQSTGPSILTGVVQSTGPSILTGVTRSTQSILTGETLSTQSILTGVTYSTPSSSATTSSPVVTPTGPPSPPTYRYTCPAGYLLTYSELQANYPRTIEQVSAAFGNWSTSPFWINVVNATGSNAIGATNTQNITGVNVTQSLTNITSSVASGFAFYDYNLTNGPVDYGNGLTVFNSTSSLNFYDPAYPRTGGRGTNEQTLVVLYINFCANNQALGQQTIEKLNGQRLNNLAAALGVAPVYPTSTTSTTVASPTSIPPTTVASPTSILTGVTRSSQSILTGETLSTQSILTGVTRSSQSILTGETLSTQSILTGVTLSTPSVLTGVTRSTASILTGVVMSTATPAARR